MKGNRIITIGRQIGSGGSEIGMEVANALEFNAMTGS